MCRLLYECNPSKMSLLSARRVAFLLAHGRAKDSLGDGSAVADLERTWDGRLSGLFERICSEQTRVRTHHWTWSSSRSLHSTLSCTHAAAPLTAVQSGGHTQDAFLLSSAAACLRHPTPAAKSHFLISGFFIKSWIERMPRRPVASATPNRASSNVSFRDSPILPIPDANYHDNIRQLRRHWKWAAFSQFFYTFAQLLQMPDVKLTVCVHVTSRNDHIWLLLA